MIGTRKTRWGAKIGMMIKNSLYPICTTIAILLLWEATVYVFSLPEYILPSPFVIIKAFFNLLGLLCTHAIITMYESLVGFLLAIVFAVLLAVIVVWSKGVEKTVMPLLVFFQTTPKIAIAPLFLVWFGFGYFPKIIICFWIAYFPIAISTITGLKDVEPDMVDLMKSMSASTLQSFIKVRIPNSLPYFFSGLKLGGVVAVLGAIVGEFVGSDAGLGYLITMAQHNQDVKLLFSVVIILAILGRSIFALICLLERYAISWHVVIRTEEEKMYTA